MDLLALRLARHWNKDPTWFHTLDKSIQIQVLAEYRLTNETPEDRKSRQDRIKRAKMQKMIANLQE